MARMLSAVSDNLFARKGDCRYATLKELVADAATRRNTSIEIDGVPTDSLIFTANDPTHSSDGESASPFSLTIDTPAAAHLPRLALTNYSLTQLATAARTPLELLQRLPARTAARVLNESIRSPRLTLTPRSLLISPQPSDGTATLRASTSERYARVWDTNVFGDIERWLAPVGFRPAVPTFNYATPNPTDIFGDDRPALWSGDRDSFGFFYTDPDPNGNDFGGLRRGIYVGNSEVGAASLSWSTFIFRDMCANFMIWGAEQIKQRRVKHVGDTARVHWIYKRELQRLASEVQPIDLRRIERAAQEAFAGDGSRTERNCDEASARLSTQFGMGKGDAVAAVNAALLPQNTHRGGPDLSPWTIANGITWEAKQSPYAASIVTKGKAAELVLASV
jgi:hypothetical protein